MSRLPKMTQNKINYWLQSPVVDAQTKEAILKSLEMEDKADIISRFGEDLKFGTGGIRGIVGAGSSRMNLYTVRKTAWAIIHFFKKKYPDQQIKLAIAYDTRGSSRPFAEACAEVFAAYDAKVFFSDVSRPTPLLSFMIKHHGCHGGVCLTASHNPSHYNGLKLYTEYGGQILSPEDNQVVELVKSIDRFEDIQSRPFASLKKHSLRIVSKELDDTYLEKISHYKSNLANKDISIVYTPLHGAGSELVPLAMSYFGFDKVHTVVEQSNMDGDFSTLKYANPEDPQSFEYALSLAKQEDADLILANDPDADRLGIMIKENEDYWFLNGHEMICLLTYYILSTRNNLASDLVIKTIVTSDLMDRIVLSFGVKIKETLTGFKWICGLIEQYEVHNKQPSLNYVCGGEESYGFLAGKAVADKDGVLACCIAAEMLCYFKEKNKSMRQVLDEIYFEHGVYREELVSQDIQGPDGFVQMRAKIESLRCSPPTQISNIKVLFLKDYLNSKQLKFENEQVVTQNEIEFPVSNVLQFILEDGSKVSVRPSGTEPKVKFYFSVYQPVGQSFKKDLDDAKSLADTKLESLKKDFLQNF